MKKKRSITVKISVPLFEKIESLKPVYYEMMPLSLEEIFIDEMGVKGYDFKNLYS